MCVICTKCGRTNVACEAMVNPNGKVWVTFYENSFANGYCYDCKNYVVLSDVDAVKIPIEHQYKEYLKEHKREPLYASCDIVWTDAEKPCSPENVIIKLSSEIIESEDDRIFFYCNGIEELKSLADFTGEDFTIVDFYNFIEI